VTLSDFASIGSLVSGVAVLVSLVYLSLQVRQSDRNQRTLLQQGLSDRNAQGAARLTEPQLAALYSKAVHNETDFTTAQVVQLTTQMRAGLLGFQDQYLLRELSLIDSIQLETQERAYKAMFALPIMRALWVSTRAHYAPEFSAYVDALLKDIPLAAPADLGDRLRADVASLLAAEKLPVQTA
jgi:hypothetical protein